MRLPAPAPFSGLVPAVVRLSFRAAQLPLAGARRQASTHPRLRVASGSGGGNSSEEPSPQQPPREGLSTEDVAVVEQWVKSAGSQELSAEDLAVVLQWLKAVANQEAGRASAPASNSGYSSGSDSAGVDSTGTLDSAGIESRGTPVPVELTETNPFPDSEPERLNAAEPLVDPSAELSKKARKLRKRGEQVLSAAQAAAAVAADLATTAAEETAAAQAAAQEEVASTAAQLAGDVASDAADVAASVQAAAKAAQQQAEEALAGAAAAAAGTSSSTGGAAAGSNAGSKLQGKLSAPQPAAGELAAPEPPAGELQAPEQPVAALPPAGATGGSGGGGGDAAADAEVEAGKRAAQLAHTKEQLVHMLASLDRGAAATDDQMDRVDALVRRLEALGGPVTLSWDRSAAGGPSSMALLDGRWRLLYSSGFSSGSLGGRRPGPSFGGGPFTLGQVYQDIFTDKEELDNCVDLFLRYSLAALPGMGGATPAASARLRHTFSVQGANTVEITFTDTEVKLAGGLQGWLDSLPRFTVPSLPEWLQPPKRLRFARFDVVYLDSEMRVTRGDRGELRVFLKGMA